MRYLLIILLALLTVSCKSSKRSLVTSATKVESVEAAKSETLGIVDLVAKADITELEVEVTKYEPVYYKHNGKDTVELKPVTYRRANRVEKTEEITKIDTTSKSQVVNTSTEEVSNRKVDSEYKFYNVVSGIVRGLTQGIFAPFAPFAWIIGLLLGIPLILWIKKKLTGGEDKI